MMRPPPDPRSLAVLDLGLLTLRAIGLAALVAAVIVRGPGSLTPGQTGVLALMVILVVVAEVLAHGLDRRGRGADRAVAAQLALDLTATVGALIVLDPPPGHGAWAIVAFPVLEGALRYGLLVGGLTWLAATVPVVGWIIAGWVPGQGADPVVDTALPLVVALGTGLPAGRAADRVLDALAETDADRAEIGRRGLLVAASSSFARRLAEVQGPQLCRVAAQAAVEIGFPAAEVALVDRRNGRRQRVAAQPPLAAGLTTVPDLTGGDLAAVAEAEAPTVFDGDDDTTIGVLAADRGHVTVLRVVNRPERPWPPRREAFELLTITAGNALAAGLRGDEADRPPPSTDPQPARDAVTGLLDRTGCTEALASLLTSLAPELEARALVVDVDRFATLNAEHGWEAGDEILQEVAGRLRRTSPDDAIVARLDADRFAVVTADPAAPYLVDHLRDVLARPLTTGVGPLTISVTIGLALSGDGLARRDRLGWATELLRQAEARARARKGRADPAPTATPAPTRGVDRPTVSPRPPDLPHRRRPDTTGREKVDQPIAAAEVGWP